MTTTVSNSTGTGTVDTLIIVSIERPDTAGGNMTISGKVQVPGVTPAPVGVNPGTLATPTPGASPIYWIIQADAVTGTMTVKQAVGGPMPTPDLSSDALTPQVLLMSDVMPASDTDVALDAVTTPDQPI